MELSMYERQFYERRYRAGIVMKSPNISFILRNLTKAQVKILKYMTTNAEWIGLCRCYSGSITHLMNALNLSKTTVFTALKVLRYTNLICVFQYPFSPCVNSNKPRVYKIHPILFDYVKYHKLKEYYKKTPAERQA